MLVKVTSKNQITIPKKIMEKFPATQYFEIESIEDAVLLKPLKIYDARLDQIRGKIDKLGLKRSSISEAVKWARTR